MQCKSEDGSGLSKARAGSPRGQKTLWADSRSLRPSPSPLTPFPLQSFANHVGPSHDPTGGVRNQQGQPPELCLLLALGAGLTVVACLLACAPLSPSSATPYRLPPSRSTTSSLGLVRFLRLASQRLVSWSDLRRPLWCLNRLPHGLWC